MLIETFARNYHWSKQDTMELYLDESIELLQRTLKGEIQDKLTWLAIISNPHTKRPQKLQRTLNNQLRNIERQFEGDEADPDYKQKLKKIFSKKR